MHGVPHRVADVLPGGVEHRGDFHPGKPPRPTSQEPLVVDRQPALARRPGNTLDRHAALRAVHAAHGVNEDHGDLPQRDELEPPFVQAVIPRTALAAARADGPAVGPRPDRDFQRGPHGILAPARRAVDEGRVTSHAVEDSLELHPGCASSDDEVLTTPSWPKAAQDALVGTHFAPPLGAAARDACAAVHRERLAGVQGRQ